MSKHDRNPFRQPPDPAPEFTEWQQHMYDPGYYLGGRIPPYLKRRRGRKNPYGYCLIFSAILTVMLAEGSAWMRLIYAGISFLLLFALVRLLKGEPRKE